MEPRRRGPILDPVLQAIFRGGIRLFREVRGMSPYREEAVVRTVATGEATLLTALSREDVASLGDARVEHGLRLLNLLDAIDLEHKTQVASERAS